MSRIEEEHDRLSRGPPPLQVPKNERLTAFGMRNALIGEKSRLKGYKQWLQVVGDSLVLKGVCGERGGDESREAEQRGLGQESSENSAKR